MEMGNVVNDDEKDAARKAHFMLRVIKDFQNYFMEMEKVLKNLKCGFHGWNAFNFSVPNLSSLPSTVLVLEVPPIWLLSQIFVIAQKMHTSQ